MPAVRFLQGLVDDADAAPSDLTKNPEIAEPARHETGRFGRSDRRRLVAAGLTERS